MMWTVNIDEKASKYLKNLDKPQKQRIEKFIDELLITDNPRAKAKP